MAQTASQYIAAIEHALGGEPDSRLDPLKVANQALSFLTNMHDWKFRKRPPLNVNFQAASEPTAVDIVSITRVAGTVTIVTRTAPVPAFEVGVSFIVVCPDHTGFSGTFAIETVISSTSATWTQGGHGDSAGTSGTAGVYAYEQFIDLPADFGELLGVCTINNAISSIIPTSLPEIAWRRGSPNAVAYDGVWRCALSFPGQATVDDPQPVPRLEIWPRPMTSIASGDLTLTYRAGSINMEYAAADDSDPRDTVPNIPPKFERLLELLCRLFAQGYDEEVVQEDPLVQAEVAMLLEADGRQDLFLGQIKGGAVQRKMKHQIREFRIVGNGTRGD